MCCHAEWLQLYRDAVTVFFQYSCSRYSKLCHKMCWRLDDGAAQAFVAKSHIQGLVAPQEL